MAARSPSLLPEMIDGNLRGLDKVFAECTWTSVRAFLAQRLCDRDGGCVAALTRLLFLQLPSKNRFDFVSFKTKNSGESPFCVPNFKRSQRRPVGPAAAYPLCETRSKADSLRQLRLGFELQPPPLSDTTLAERLPLRVPVIHDYAQRSTTERSTHGRRHGSCASQP